MSNPYRKKLSLLDQDLNACSDSELAEKVSEQLANGIHGICFSPYIEGQGPGTRIPEEQTAARLDYVADSVKWVRSFSCREGHEKIPGLAKARGLETMVGVWIDDDLEANEVELNKGIELACAGEVSILAIGNKVLLREELSVEHLVSYLERARQAVPENVQIGYVDAY